MQIFTTFELGRRNSLYLGAILTALSWSRALPCSVLRKTTAVEGRCWMKDRSCSIPEPGSFPKHKAGRGKQDIKRSCAERASKRAAGTV